MLTPEDEGYFFRELRERLPYGVALWPASIALAHELVSRGDALRGRRVLELGAGTGLPGIVAASLGAVVVQTDRHELPLSMSRRNAERNAATATTPVEHRLADWTLWDDATRYDVILGADILYGEAMQPHLRHIFEGNLAPGGRILLSDPIRPVSLKLLDELEADGWRITMSRWTVGEESAPRTIAVFELTAPADGAAAAAPAVAATGR